MTDELYILPPSESVDNAGFDLTMFLPKEKEITIYLPGVDGAPIKTASI